MQRNEFDSEGILFEAASWVLQLENGPLGSEDRAALKEWAERSPAHAQALRDYSEAWGAVDETILEASNGELDALKRSWGGAHNSARPLWIKGLVPVAAILSLVFYTLISFFGVPEKPMEQKSTVIYATAVGEQAQFKLGDGSKVHLNTGSRIEVDYQQDRRLVRLLTGEAHFEVVKNLERPFDVIAADKQISAVGTAFAVRLTNVGVNITVTEGVVGVATPLPLVKDEVDSEIPEREYQALLEPNDTMVIEDGVSKIAKVEGDFVERRLSWRTGRLQFQDDSLAYVLDEVSRYTQTRIILSDGKLGDLRIGGVFNAGEIDALLTALEVSFDLKAEQIDEKTIYLSSRNNS